MVLGFVAFPYNFQKNSSVDKFLLVCPMNENLFYLTEIDCLKEFLLLKSIPLIRQGY